MPAFPLLSALLLMLVPAASAGEVEPGTGDVIVVLGCPTTDDGELGACLRERVAWAACLFERGVAPAIITSGGAAHAPFVEAEAMAAGLEALGVPADAIWVEGRSLHTDENCWNALGIARAQGWERIVVASHGSHARGACAYLESWGASCVAARMQKDEVARVLEQRGGALDRVRAASVPGWVNIAAQERARAVETGDKHRGSSFWLYTRDAFRSLLGLEPILPYQPPNPGTEPCWADHPNRAGREVLAPRD